MRRFSLCITIAVAVMLTALLGLTAMNVSASSLEISNDVVFISDEAVPGGDGTSADSPLYPYDPPAHLVSETTNSSGVTTGRYYYKTALYQAAEKLADRGGTIVICGPVVIGANQSYGSGSANRDFFMPTSDKPIKITSVYNGVDYWATAGAYFGIELPAQITLGAPTEFENITIETKGATRVICANTNKLVMGEGVNCQRANTSSDFLSLAGATRYLSINGESDITIKSGTYKNVAGSIWGLDVSGKTYVQDGNVNISVEGGIVDGVLCGGAINASATSVNGDINISVYPDAYLSKGIYVTGQAQFASAGRTATVNIYGGTYTASSAKINKYYTFKSSAGTNLNYPASTYSLNISNADITPQSSSVTKASLLNTFVSSARTAGFTDIRYPSEWITSVSVVNKPTTQYLFKNDKLTAEGAVLNVSYLNKYDNVSTYSRTISYAPTDIAFSSSCATDKVGAAAASHKYGSYQYCTDPVEIVAAPEIELLGARIKTSGSTQKLRYEARFSKELAEGMTVIEYGLISNRADLMQDSSQLNFDNTYGMLKTLPGSDDLNSDLGSRIYYSCTTGSIPQNRFNIDEIARAYIKLDYKGETAYVYSDVIRRNPYSISKQAIAADSKETADTKAYLQTGVIDVHDNYTVENEYVVTNVYRNRVVNYMKSQMNMKWTAGESFWINNPKDASGVTTNLYFEKGKTYYGIPYTNAKFSQYETFSEYTADGVLSPSEIEGVTACGNTTADEATALNNYKNFPGSDCSTAVVTAWNTVLNNRTSLKNLTATKQMVPGNNCGVIPVGDYAYDYATYGNDTYAMTADTANAAKVRAAYSLMKPGDAIVHYDMTENAGHTRLVVSVDTTNKKVTTIECANWSIPNCTVKSGNGTSTTLTNNNTSWKQLTYTYDYLIKTGYVPITIPELATGHSDSEYTFITGVDLARSLPEGKLTGKAISNRQIIDVNVTVSDGTTTQKVIYKPADTAKYSAVHAGYVDLSAVDMSSISLVSGKSYSFSLDIRVSGLSTANPTVKLVTDYTFTAK